MTLHDDCPALARLFGSRLDEFARAWGSAVVAAPRAERSGDDVADLFSLAAVDELIADRGLRTPFLRLAKNGRTLPDSAFTLGGGVGAGIGDQISDDRVRRQFADGATIVLQGLHRTWAPLTGFGQALAAELGHPVQINAYITPPQNQGFDHHYDIHDVFVVQVHGTKRWIVHPPVLDAPLRSQTWDQRAADVELVAGTPPLLELTLEAGDVLYLPRGFVHAAVAQGEISAHLTIGVHTWTRHHLAEAMLDAARTSLAGDADIRASLPLGVDVGDAAALAGDVESVRAALLERIAALEPDAVAVALLGRSRAGQRPSSLPPLAQLGALDHLAPDAVLRLRPHLLATLDAESPDSFAVRSRAGRFVLPAESRPGLEELLAGGTVRVGALAGSTEAALAAARTLVVEGVAVPA